MYPDTDLPPMSINQDRLDNIKNWLPEQHWIRQEWYRKLGIPEDTVKELSVSVFAELFKKAVKEWKTDPVAAAVILIQYPKRLKKKFPDISTLNEGVFYKILKWLAEGKIPRDAVLSVMINILELGYFVEEVIPNPATESEVKLELINSNSELNNFILRKDSNRERIMMGMVMKKLRGKIDAVSIAEKIGFRKEEINNGK